MGTHPIFESDFDCLTVCRMSTKCLMLIQPTKRPEGRNYTDYNTRAECFDAICKIYENMLKRQNPSEDSISYDMQQLLDFIDELHDICVMTYNEPVQSYTPRTKSWLKKALLDHKRSC